MKKIIVLLGMLLLSFPGYELLAAAPEPLDRIVAVVNDEVVTWLELEKKTDELIRKFNAEGQQLPAREVIENSILEKMIARKVQLQLARKTGIRVNDTDINHTLKRLAENNGMSLERFREEIEKEDVVFNEFRKQIREEMMIAQLRNRDVSRYVQITDKEVERFLISERESFFGENEYLVSHILLRPPAGASAEERDKIRAQAEEILEKLKQGKSMADILDEKEMYAGLSGGDLHWEKLKKLPRVFSQQVISMERGDLSPVLESERGFHIVKLNDYRKENAQRSDESMREEARRMLFEKRIDERGQRWLRQLVDEAYVDIRL